MPVPARVGSSGAARPCAAGDDCGFTLVEVLVAATVLMVSVLGLLAMLDTANAKTETVRARDGATNLARQVTEAARSIPYGALTPGTVEGQLQAQPGLARQGTGAGWTIQRRGVSYGVSATVCAIDDPADGAGPHDSGLFCSDSAAAGSADQRPDDYKRVAIHVSWNAGTSTRRVHQVALINNPGSGGGPAVRDLALSSPTSATITSEVSAVVLAVTTSSPAASVSWSVDGVARGTAAGAATSWGFSWPVSQLADGTYLVTAQAFDQSGLSGAMRSVTVTLNRSLASAPTGVAGGRNGAVVDFEWLPNPERDVVGYRVYRVVPGGSDVAVCPLTRATACQDTDPPDGSISYYVVANDRDPAGHNRDGARSEPITVTTSNRAPHTPQHVSATRGNGVTTLSWTASAPADPDGDAIAFYRIYRDGKAFADRYDRTGSGTELSLVDSRTDGTEHEYWVVAVDGQLAESAPVGPVIL
jgi:hypothetical protein